MKRENDAWWRESEKEEKSVARECKGTNGRREWETETKDEVRARVVFERDTVASHREETVAGLPQGCLHRRGESYTKRGPHPIFHSSSCFVSFFFFFFSFGFIIIRWCFVPRHLARRDRLIETTDVDRLSRDFASKRFYRLRGTFLRRFDKQWCNVLMWLFTLIVIVQGVKDDHPFSSSWRDLDMGIDGCLQWGRENRSSVDRSVILERLCVTMEKYIDEKNMANYI